MNREIQRALSIEYTPELAARLIRDGIRDGTLYECNIAVLAILRHEPSVIAMCDREDRIIYHDKLIRLNEPVDVIRALDSLDALVSAYVGMGLCSALSAKAAGLIKALSTLIGTEKYHRNCQPIIHLMNYHGKNARAVNRFGRALRYEARPSLRSFLLMCNAKMSDENFYKNAQKYILPIALRGLL